MVFNRFSLFDIGFGVAMIILGTGTGALGFSLTYRIAVGGSCGF